MDTLSLKTLSATPETIQKNWVVIDAEGIVRGRVCSEIEMILRGKNKPS
ncbi:MAG: uL13 family ribosomal protein, partial [Muribaculaceae bacterium]|nr:uL13 family ribosomal protein [Muribaculaceae bacterium]